jgi:hypothetical protein
MDRISNEEAVRWQRGFGSTKKQQGPKINEVSAHIRKESQVRTKEGPRSTKTAVRTIGARMGILEAARWRQALGLQKPQELNVVERIVSGKKTGISQPHAKTEPRPDNGVQDDDPDTMHRQQTNRGNTSEREEQGPKAEDTKVRIRKGKERAYQSCTDDPRTPIDTRTIEDNVDK